MLADLSVYNRGGDHLCVLRPETHEVFVKTLQDHLPFEDVRIEDVSAQGNLWFVSGPRHRALLRNALAGCPAIDSGCGTCTWRDHSIGIAAYPPESEHDHLLEIPHKTAVAFIEMLLGLGQAAGIRLVGRQAQEILRVEAGRPLLGTDFDESHFPSEVGLEEAIDPAKTSHVGAGALAETLRGGSFPKRRLVGLRSEGEMSVGTFVHAVSGVCGRITSAVLSPRLGSGLSLAMLDRPPNPTDEFCAGPSGPSLTITPLPVAE